MNAPRMLLNSCRFDWLAAKYRPARRYRHTAFTLIDGSVHHIAYSVDQQVYRYLGNRRDGRSVEVPQ